MNGLVIWILKGRIGRGFLYTGLPTLLKLTKVRSYQKIAPVSRQAWGELGEGGSEIPKKALCLEASRMISGVLSIEKEMNHDVVHGAQTMP